ncbi:hypothetical protein, partial [Actinoplanes sp. DH11]|uniref:hypothetical protein n=1 Tax=Actinoplanes sp. DH11 TaxID=2857011 RepID=UPI001E4F142A
RVVPGPDGRAAVELSDESGAPVASVRALTLRPLPVSPPAADAVAGGLHRTAWVPVPPGSLPVPRWGVLGASGTGLVDVLAPPGSGVPVYAGPAAAGGGSPAVVVAPIGPPPEGAGDAEDPAAGCRW